MPGKSSSGEKEKAEAEAKAKRKAEADAKAEAEEKTSQMPGNTSSGPRKKKNENKSNVTANQQGMNRKIRNTTKSTKTTNTRNTRNTRKSTKTAKTTDTRNTRNTRKSTKTTKTTDTRNTRNTTSSMDQGVHFQVPYGLQAPPEATQTANNFLDALARHLYNDFQREDLLAQQEASVEVSLLAGGLNYGAMCLSGYGREQRGQPVLSKTRATANAPTTSTKHTQMDPTHLLYRAFVDGYGGIPDLVFSLGDDHVRCVIEIKTADHLDSQKIQGNPEFRKDIEHVKAGRADVAIWVLPVTSSTCNTSACEVIAKRYGGLPTLPKVPAYVWELDPGTGNIDLPFDDDGNVSQFSYRIYPVNPNYVMLALHKPVPE